MLEKVVESKYAIESPSYSCQGCQSEVPPGGNFFSSIFFEGEAFLRKEFCPPCWGKSNPEAIYAFWRARRPEPKANPPKRRRFDIDLLWEFFLRLGKDLEAPPADPAPSPIEAPPAETLAAAVTEKVRLRFLLALLLVRGKRLILAGSGVQEGQEWLRLLEKGSDKNQPPAVHLAANPNLSTPDLEKVKESLGQLLQMEL